MTRLIQGILCSKFAAPRQHEKFSKNQTFDQKIGSQFGTAISWAGVTVENPYPNGIILLPKVRRVGRKLLVLRLRGQAFESLRVVDDLPQQFLAEWRQRALP